MMMLGAVLFAIFEQGVFLEAVAGTGQVAAGTGGGGGVGGGGAGGGVFDRHGFGDGEGGGARGADGEVDVVGGEGWLGWDGFWE